MKKLLTVTVLAVMLVMVAMTAVNAATSDSLTDELYAIGSKYGMKEAEKVKMQRYLADYPLSNADCDKILALAQQADQIMKDNNTTDYKTLPADIKEQLKSLANQAASIAGVTLTFDADGIKVYDKDGKLIESVDPSTSGKLAYTGNSVNAILGISALAVIGLAVIAKIK